MSTKLFASSCQDQVIGPEFYEAKGSEYYSLAMRSRSVAVFRKRIIQSRNAFSRAGGLYGARRSLGLESRCRAWQLYLGFYLTRKPRTQKMLLEKSWRLA